ncbi:MAG TPA: hypothetical protein VMT20_03315 [Terriglobia bacterium]|nr:hypothetical protein [Terriglobia bacterium]
MFDNKRLRFWNRPKAGPMKISRLAPESLNVIEYRPIIMAEDQLPTWETNAAVTAVSDGRILGLIVSTVRDRRYRVQPCPAKKSRNEGGSHDIVDNKGSILGTHDVDENKLVSIAMPRYV